MSTAVVPLRRDRRFLRFWAGQTSSVVGEQVSGVALPIVAIATLHAGEFQVGLLNAVETLAFLVVGLPAGAWVDRMLKRRVMLRADLARAVLLLAVPLLWTAGLLQIWQLLVVGTLVGVASLFFDVGYQSFIPVLVPPDRIADANGRLDTSAQVARIAGPAVAAGLLAVLAAPLTLLVTAATYAGSFATLLSVRDDEPRPSREARRSLVVEIREGLAWVLGQRLLVRIVASVALGNLSGGIATTMLPVLALRTLAIPPAVYGAMAALGAVGGVVGGVLAAPLSRRIGEGTIVPISAAGLSIGLLITASAGAVPEAGIALLVAGDLVFGFWVLVVNIVTVSYRQRICPPALLGRMNASVRFVVWGVIPIGGLASGLLGTWLGAPVTVGIGAVASLSAVAVVLFSPLTRLRRLPEGATSA